MGEEAPCDCPDCFGGDAAYWLRPVLEELCKSARRAHRVCSFNGCSKHTVKILAYRNIGEPHYGTAEKRGLFFKELVERLQNSPGVQAVGLVDLMPLSRGEHATNFEAQGYPNDKDRLVEARRITPNYFSAMEIAQIRGRSFTDEDGPGQPEVVVVNNALAKEYFGSNDVVGKHVRRSANGSWATIIGAW